MQSRRPPPANRPPVAVALAEGDAVRAYRAAVTRALQTVARAEHLLSEISEVVAMHHHAVLAYGIYVPPLPER